MDELIVGAALTDNKQHSVITGKRADDLPGDVMVYYGGHCAGESRMGLDYGKSAGELDAAYPFRSDCIAIRSDKDRIAAGKAIDILPFHGVMYLHYAEFLEITGQSGLGYIKALRKQDILQFILAADHFA